MPFKRSIYIDNKPVAAAKALYEKNIPPLGGVEHILVYESLGRITAEPIFAIQSAPHYHCSAMDGIAVVAKQTFGATQTHPKQLKIGQDCLYVNTGNPLPEGYDSVIMIEDIHVEGDMVSIQAGAHPYQHVRLVGEDCVAGEMLAPSDHRIRPFDVGAFLTAGVESVAVYRPIKVGILPTGSEIVNQVSLLKHGHIMDSNSFVFEGLLKEMGACPKRYKPVPDDEKLLEAAILKGVAENDILLVNAGSSAGEKDYTKSLLEGLGEVIVHGVGMKPGKPTILAKVSDKPVIGLPGYPVSAYFAFDTFVVPLIEQAMGIQHRIQFCKAILNQRVVSSLKHEEHVRVTLGEVAGNWFAVPLSRHAGSTTSLVKADGILSVPQSVEGYESGQSILVRCLKAQEDLKARLVVTGSHDMILDIVAEHLPMVSSHVGSLGGISALKKGACHLAPIHFLDEHTGQYNTHLVNQFFKEEQMVLIRGVKRLQGLMVPKENPKDIKGLKDLLREDVTFINRQRGSGTRQLVDYHLKRLYISEKDIKGYDRELATHLAIAEAVRSRGADCGVGIYSAAMSMGLDFIPLGYEAYDFIAYASALEDHRVQRFLEVLKRKDFKDSVMALGGYEIEAIGSVL